MTLKYPTDWLDLPETITYEKDQSKKFSTKSEPEYIISNSKGTRFLIRVYEEGDKEIVPYDILGHKTKRVGKNESFNKVLRKLYDLMTCEFLHNPSEGHIQYRGYDPQQKIVIEYTKNCEFAEKELRQCSVLSFEKSGVNSDRMQNKGKHIATIKINTIQSAYYDDSYRTKEIYENVLIQRDSDGEILELSPIPDKKLISISLNEWAKTDRMEIETIKDEFKPSILANNI